MERPRPEEQPVMSQVRGLLGMVKVGNDMFEARGGLVVFGCPGGFLRVYVVWEGFFFFFKFIGLSLEVF